MSAGVCIWALMEKVKAHAEAVTAAFPAHLPDSDAIVLIVKHPSMPFLEVTKATSWTSCMC